MGTLAGDEFIGALLSEATSNWEQSWIDQFNTSQLNMAAVAVVAEQGLSPVATSIPTKFNSGCTHAKTFFVLKVPLAGCVWNPLQQLPPQLESIHGLKGLVGKYCTGEH